LEEGKCKCGRAFPLIGSIIGRLDDVVITPEGRIIGFLLYYAIHGIRNVRATQIIQDKLDELSVLVVPKRGFSKSESVRIEENIKERVGEGMKITVNLVNEIALLPNGKFRGVISKVKW
jgi:phenylacetate-CoA ligase